MTANPTKEYYDNEWENTIKAHEDNHQIIKEKILSEFKNNTEELPKEYQRFLNAEHTYDDLTKIYYDLISDDLQNSFELPYNGALIVDLNSDPKTFLDQDVDNIIKYAQIEDENSVLECGCGSGYFFKRLIQKKPNIKYKGIDLSANQIVNAKKLNSKHSRRFKQSNWNNIEYVDESFDRVIFLETIGYANDIDKLLSECWRVLKPGGVLFSKHPGCLLENYHSLTQIDENIKLLSREYGYTENSLGMMMNVPFFVRKLQEHGFNILEGPLTPPRDESLYVKTHFIEEVHSCFETTKVGNSFLSIRYPNGSPLEFWEKVGEVNPNLQPNTILSGLGRLHPNLVNFFKQVTFVEKHSDDEYSVYRSGQKIMSPCVLVTATKV